jgi:hypothetical protein
VLKNLSVVLLQLRDKWTMKRSAKPDVKFVTRPQDSSGSLPHSCDDSRWTECIPATPLLNQLRQILNSEPLLFGLDLIVITPCLRREWRSDIFSSARRSSRSCILSTQSSEDHRLKLLSSKCRSEYSCFTCSIGSVSFQRFASGFYQTIDTKSYDLGKPWFSVNLKPLILLKARST